MAAIDVHLVVRWMHVVAAMVVGGGAVLLAWICWRPTPALHVEAILDVARQYELLFWAAFGVVVAAGVGNLGAFGSGLPGAETEWGTTLTLKLGLVILVAALSVARTLVVVTIEGGNTIEAGRTFAVLRIAYVSTSVALLGVVALAEVLAHG